MDQPFVARVQAFAAPDDLQPQQRQASPIECGKGQNMDDGKIQAKNRGEVEYRDPAKRGKKADSLASKADNARRPGDLMNVKCALKYAANQVAKANQHKSSLLHCQPWN